MGCCLSRLKVDRLNTAKKRPVRDENVSVVPIAFQTIVPFFLTWSRPGLTTNFPRCEMMILYAAMEGSL